MNHTIPAFEFQLFGKESRRHPRFGSRIHIRVAIPALTLSCALPIQDEVVPYTALGAIGQPEFPGLFYIGPRTQAHFAQGLYHDGRLTGDRALVLAIAAAVAAVFVNDRYRHPVPWHELIGDGVVGADLVADEAAPALFPGNAPGRYDAGGPHLGMLLLLQVQGPDGPCRAEVSADIAILFAPGHPGHNFRRPDSRKSRLKPDRL